MLTIADKQPKPLEFDYRDTVREALPSLEGRELDVLLDFLDHMLQMDSRLCATPTDLLTHPWLLQEDSTAATR